jgi:hypothetical protein
LETSSITPGSAPESGQASHIVIETARTEREAIELSIVVPCLDEAETLGACIDGARAFLARAGVAGEVIVADNGSRDASRTIAAAHGARVVEVPVRGYGSTLLGGCAAARGEFVIMGDAGVVDQFASLDAFVDALRGGADMVLGSPARRGIGLRGVRRRALVALASRTASTEFASEMVVNALLRGMRVTEVATTSRRRGVRLPRLRLSYSSLRLLLYPGVAFVAGGLALMLAQLVPSWQVVPLALYANALPFGGAFVVLRTQCITFAMLAEIFDAGAGRRPFATCKWGLLLGACIVALGVLWTAVACFGWEPIAIPAVTALAAGTQIALASSFAYASFRRQAA